MTVAASVFASGDAKLIFKSEGSYSFTAPPSVNAFLYR